MSESPAPQPFGSPSEAAVWWVRWVPVVPLALTLSNGPRPLVRWKEGGPLRTKVEVREFWAANPSAQLAIVLGPTADGRFLGAVDTDLKNRKEGMPEPPTGYASGYRHSTKSGGTHDLFLYKTQPPETVARRATGVGGFVDVLLDGLLVVPPTKFDGAGEYRVVRDGPIPEFEAVGLALDQAAPWLRQAWKEHRPKAVAAGRRDDTEPVPEGSRHATLLSRAGKLRDLGVGAEAILADLRDFNGRRCAPPLTDSELVSLAGDVTRRYEPKHEVVVEPGTDGPGLFREVVSVLKRHYFMDEDWHYAVSALGVLQSYLAPILPRVFYLFYGGRFGSGKTNILDLMAHLTGGLLLENVSPAALARVLGDPEHPARTLCIDEADVERGRDLMEVRDALIRQGYRVTAAPYVRWDPAKKTTESVPIYGMKVLSYRGGLDDALTSRGFTIPTATPDGESGFDYVLRNLAPQVGDLPRRLAVWGREVARAWPQERVAALYETDNFRSKVKAAVAEGRFGANRDSELAAVAVLVAEVAGADLTAELRAASELRKVALTDSEGSLVEELRDAILAEAGAVASKLDSTEPEVRVRQKALKDRVNRELKGRGERPVSDKSLASARRNLGVKDAWLRTPQRRVVYVLPSSFIRSLRGDSTPLGSPDSPDSLSRPDVKGEPSEPSESRGEPGRPGSDPDPGDLFGGRSTRADRARAAFDQAERKEGER